MTKKKSTKKALLFSAISLLVCFSMLVGTTFAWFTDSVTSSGNIIKTGTLDVEMYWAMGTEDPAGASWEDASAGAIFDYDNWEPGYVAVRHIKIANVGSLALKYQLNIVANGDVSELADVLDVYFIDPATAITDRADLVDAYKLGTLSEVLVGLEAGEIGGNVLEANKSVEVTIALKMQESAGNEYQNKEIGAEFAIQLVATQATVETDDIDDQYDAGATYPNVSAQVAVPDTATEPVTLVAKDVKVEIPAEVLNNLPDEVTSVAVSYTAPQVDVNTGVVSFESVDLVDQDGNVIDLTANTAPVTVVLPAQTALAGRDVVVMHDGIVVASTTVAADGAITYTANHFCEVTVVTATKVGTAAELVAAVANGGNIQLTDDITITDKLTITADTAIYGMGNTLTYTGSDRAITADNSGVEVDLTINDLTVNCAGSSCQRGINYNDSGKLTLNNVIVTGANVTYALNLPGSSDDAIVVINDCALTGNIALNVWGENATITVNNTVLTSVDKAVAENYTAIALNNDASTNVANGTVIYINGGKIIAEDEKGEPSTAVRNDTKTGKVNLSDETEVVGEIRSAVAFIMYKDANGEYMDNFYASFSLQKAIEEASKSNNAVIVLAQDIVLDKAVTIVSGVSLVIDLNGYTISGTCDEGQGYLFMVNNGAKLTILDSSADESGKITFAQGTSNVGWAIDLEGELVLESGTIELTGDSWSIGYCVDVRPNAWGTAYAKPTVFTMNGGKVVSSDGAIRVASSSSAIYTGVSAKFVMNGGEVEAAWDGIFVQQSDEVYDILTVELNGGKVASALSPVRVYGPVATSVVGGAEKPMTLKIGANAELSVIGEIDTSRTWYKDGVVVLGGGMTVEALNQYATIVIAE